jgi:hypothetical protein
MKPRYPVRVHIAAALAAVLPLWGAAAFYEAHKIHRTLGDPYMVEAQATRLRGLAAAVPGDAMLGYLSNAEAGSALAQGLFFSARYTLAPRLLREGPGSHWTLGNFTQPLDYAAFGAPHGLLVERDFGNGVVLFRKERP